MFLPTHLINFYWFVCFFFFCISDSIIGIRIKTGNDKLHIEENILPSNELMAIKSQPQISPPPPSSSLSQASLSSNPPPPTITITTSEDDEPLDGMLDRISHDLDYLLNRTMQVPVVVRRNVANNQIENIPSSKTSLVQSQSNKSDFLSMTSAETCTSNNTSTFILHEVIIEESEE